MIAISGRLWRGGRRANAPHVKLVDEAPVGGVSLRMNAGALPIGGMLRAAPLGQWQTAIVPLRCFAQRGVDMTKVEAPFTLVTEGKVTLSISDVRIDSAAVNQDQCGQP